MRKVLIVAGDDLRVRDRDDLNKILAQHGIQVRFCLEEQSSLRGAEMMLILTGGEFKPSLLRHMGEVARSEGKGDIAYCPNTDPTKILSVVRIALNMSEGEGLAATGS